MGNVNELLELVRALTPIALDYQAKVTRPVEHSLLPLQGHSPAKLDYAVAKTTTGSPSNLWEQADFMLLLGDEVCPRILCSLTNGYVMEYARPVLGDPEAAIHLELLLYSKVWNRLPFPCDNNWREELKQTIGIDVPDWAVDEKPCLIHGDATVDNMLLGRGTYLITDPIPTKYLNRPSIPSVDRGRILQSVLGWEVVLRGIDPINWAWPVFMFDYIDLHRALFWCMVVLKRIARKDANKPGQWAKQVAEKIQCALKI